MSQRTARLLLLALLAGAAVLFGIGITWGFPSWNGWAVDELHPDSWSRAVDPETPTGWHARYPPFHFQVLHTVSQPFRWTMAEDGPFPRDRWHQNLVLVLMARSLSLLMALGMLLVVYRAGRALGRLDPDQGRRAGLFTAFVVTLTAPLVYYAKTANLEAPYLLWFSLSVLFYLRLQDRARLRDGVLFGLAVGATVATKDQAYALYALAPLPVLLALARLQEAPSPAGRLLCALVDRRLLAAGAAGAVGYALFQNIPFNLGRFRHHVELLLGPMSGPYREFGHGFGDQLRIAGRFLGQVFFALDPLLFAACLAGALWVAARAVRARRPGAVAEAPGDRPAEPVPLLGGSPQGREAWLLGSLLLLAVSYYATLIAVIGFTFDRYVLPSTLLLAFAGGRFFHHLLERFPRPGALALGVRLVVAATFVYAAVYAASVDTRMLADSRYDLEAWAARWEDERQARLAAAGAEEAPPAVLAIGRPKHLPRLQRVRWRKVHRTRGRVLDQMRPVRVVINLTDVRGPREQAFVEAMDRGEHGYVRTLTHRGEPLFDWLGKFPGLRLLEQGDLGSTQRFVNPEYGVWQRLPQ